MRRRAGIGGLQKDAALREQYRAAGSALEAESREKLREQAEMLRANVEAYAVAHRAAIAANPALAGRFQKMCTALGVDTLVSARESETAEKKTGFTFFRKREEQKPKTSAFHAELAVQVVEQCMLLANETGGLTDAALVRRRLSRVHNRSDVSDADIVTAVESLRPLALALGVVSLGPGRIAVQSLPLDLSPDGAALLAAAEAHGGRLAPRDPATAFAAWAPDRLERGIRTLLEAGLLWLDTQDASFPGSSVYWSPGLYPGLY